VKQGLAERESAQPYLPRECHRSPAHAHACCAHTALLPSLTHASRPPHSLARYSHVQGTPVRTASVNKSSKKVKAASDKSSQDAAVPEWISELPPKELVASLREHGADKVHSPPIYFICTCPLIYSLTHSLLGASACLDALETLKNCHEACTCTHARTHARTHAHAHTRTHAHANKRARALTHTHTHTQGHAVHASDPQAS